MADKCLHCLKDMFQGCAAPTLLKFQTELHGFATLRINLCHSQLVGFPCSFLQYLQMVHSSVPGLFIHKFTSHIAPSLSHSRKSQIQNNYTTLSPTHRSFVVPVQKNISALIQLSLEAATNTIYLCMTSTLPARSVPNHKKKHFQNTYRQQTFHLQMFLTYFWCHLLLHLYLRIWFVGLIILQHFINLWIIKNFSIENHGFGRKKIKVKENLLKRIRKWGLWLAVFMFIIKFFTNTMSIFIVLLYLYRNWGSKGINDLHKS